MNASLALPEQDSIVGVPHAVRQALRNLLASPAFAKAPRMCHLLSFLVEQKLNGKEQEISEYAIGLEVFRRDARLYDTTLDPVVRVQMGRLRERLATYYASFGAACDVEITIPPGNYIPTVRHADALTPALPVRHQQICLTPLRDLSAQHASSSFVSGVDEELGSTLFKRFGAKVRLLADGTKAAANADAIAPQRLEGSIRVEHDHVRASMRLVDPEGGHISWLAQFDCCGPLGMPLQEELACAICGALQQHLATL